MDSMKDKAVRKEWELEKGRSNDSSEEKEPWDGEMNKSS